MDGTGFLLSILGTVIALVLGAALALVFTGNVKIYFRK
jgi:hypothetical protein